jgi:hypothetical protein
MIHAMKWVAASSISVFVLAVVACVGDDPVTAVDPSGDDSGAAEGGDSATPTTDGAADSGADAHVSETRWAFSFPVTSFSTPYIATGADGSVAITGTYVGSPTVGTTVLPQATAQGIFVARLDPKGVPVWVKGWNVPQIPGTPDFIAGVTAVALGDDNRVYLAGDGSNFSFGSGGDVPVVPVGGTGAERHGFVVRFKAADGAVDGITLVKAQAGASARQLKLDRLADSMVIAGSFTGTLSFDETATTVGATCGNGFCGIFAAKYDGATPTVTWAKSGTIANASVSGSKMHDIAINDDVVIAASFVGTAASWTGAASPENAVGLSSAEDVLIVKLANNGGLVWMKAYGDPSALTGPAPDGAQPASPNSVTIAKDKTVFVGGSFDKRVKLGSTTLTAPPPSSGPNQPSDGFFAALSATTGDALWARAVSGADSEDVPSVMAFSGGDVLAAARYQSGGIVVDGKPLENPATDGAGIALLRYTTAGTLVSAVSTKGLRAGLGPKVAPLPGDGIAVAVGMTGTMSLGPFSASSDVGGTKPSMIYGGFTP